MSRRPHKKSRNGCLECKRRHIRCDGNHPVCANCGAAEIKCSFLGHDSLYIVQEFPLVRPDTVIAKGTVSDAASVSNVGEDPIATSPHERFEAYGLNMTHLRLFNNLYSEEFRSVEQLAPPDIIPAGIYIENGLKTPYLMHQLLASSALHLSTTTPDSCHSYRQYSTGLQNHALSLFKESHPSMEITADNCVPMFLFSSLVGVHILCDTLLYQRESLDQFIHNFTTCLHVNRGVLTIIRQSRDLLHQTELAPSLKRPETIMNAANERGKECDVLLELINTANLTPASQNAYREAVLCLQQAYNSQYVAPGGKPGLPMVFVWPVLVSPEYVDLLREHQAVALVILAYYAVLLHRGRDMWLVAGSGHFLIKFISTSLGPSWQEWLKFPLEAIKEKPSAQI